MAQPAPSKKQSSARMEVVGSDVLDAPASIVDIDDRRFARLGGLIVLFGVGGFF